MRIQVVRSGGFTGMPVECAFDENDLEPEEAQQLRDAVQESQFFALPTRLPDHSGGADQFNYTVTVEEKGRNHTVIGTESALPGELDKIVQKLIRKSRGQ
jgi:hypothetical protein